MKRNRTFNIAANSLVGVISYIIVFLCTFITRGFIAQYLGKEILGVNSLFTNMVTILSMAELGLSAAMVMFLYKPLADNNHEKIKSFMRCYRNLYMIIFTFIFLAGCIVCIFIDYFAKTDISLAKLRLYFMLFVLNTCVTYLSAYKKSILHADQQNRIVSIVHMFSRLLMTLFQAFFLMITKSFLIYLILIIFSNLLENIICNLYVNHEFPYIKEKNIVPLTSNEKKNIYRKVKPMFIQRIASTVLTSTDNLIISVYISVGEVGVYSNYLLISQTIISIFGQIYASFTTSFGNLAASEGNVNTYPAFKRFNFLSSFLLLNACSLYLVLIQPFIQVWLGSEYITSIQLPLLIVICLYFNLMNYTLISIQNALGLHKYDEKASVIQVIFNVAASILMVKQFGVNGVVMGTILSILCFPSITKPYIIYKYVFKKPIILYFRFFARMTMTVACVLLGNVFITQFQLVSSFFLNVILNTCISIIFCNLIFIVFHHKSTEFNNLKNMFIGIYKLVSRRFVHEAR